MIKAGFKTFNTDLNTLNKIVQDKLTENTRLSLLNNYYQGKHRILNRYYPEGLYKPNNKVVVNYCKLIVDFLTSYLVGVPVKYDGAEQKIQDILTKNYDAEVMMGVITDSNTFGFGVEFFYVDEQGELKYDNVSPLESIVILDDTISENMLAYMRLIERDDKLVYGYDLFVYTPDEILQFDVNSVCVVGKTISRIPNTLGVVPISLYYNDDYRQGSFEQIISLQDSLNKIYSDSVNDFEEFVDSFLVLEGMEATQQEDIIAMKQNRVILAPPDSKSYWLTKDTNRTHIKQLQDDISKEIMRLGNIPDISDVTGFNVSGESMRFRLIYTEIHASQQESYAKRAIEKKLEIITNYLNLLTGENIGSIIKPVFTRNFMVSEPEGSTNPKGDSAIGEQKKEETQNNSEDVNV